MGKVGWSDGGGVGGVSGKGDSNGGVHKREKVVVLHPPPRRSAVRLHITVSLPS